VASVLVHEYDEHVRSLLEAQLAALGHEALLIGEGSMAWQFRHFDVAVVETATSPGLHLARELHATRPDTPLVVVSVIGPTDETRALAPTAHLVKPVRLAELGRALAEAFALSAPVALRC
jgi:CheY-like chemotaxis protein